MWKYREFRNLIFYRIPISKLFKFLAPPLPTLYICAGKIGKCLFIQHGFSTIIAANSIGDYCWINQQVTIGFTDSKNAPIIGNNVHVYAGAIIIGGVKIGDNAVIGAGATTVKDVPCNATVVGPAAQIIKIKN